MPTLRTALAPAPQRGDGSDTFADDADAYIASMKADADQANAQIVEANDFAVRAETAAATAVLAPGTSATSVSSVAISLGAKTFTVQAGKAFVQGMWVTAQDTTNASNWLAGPITAYNATSGALAINVPAGCSSGSGTPNSWSIAISPPIRFVPASKEQIWAGTENGAAVTPARLREATAPQALAFATPLTFNGAAGWNQTSTVTSNFQLAAPANLVPGQTYTLRLTIGGAGGWTWNTVGYEWTGGQTPNLPTAAGSIIEVLFRALTASTATASTRRISG